jgi:hypothetical protein
VGCAVASSNNKIERVFPASPARYRNALALPPDCHAALTNLRVKTGATCRSVSWPMKPEASARSAGAHVGVTGVGRL